MWVTGSSAHWERHRQPTLIRLAPASGGHAKKVHRGLDLLGHHLTVAYDAKPPHLGSLQQWRELWDHHHFRDKGCPSDTRDLDGQGTVPIEPQGGRIDDNIKSGWIDSTPGLHRAGGRGTPHRVGQILCLGLG